MNSLLATTLVAAATLSPLAAHAQRIGVTMVDCNDTFRSLLRNGVADAAKKAGATVPFEDGRSDVSTQLSPIQNLIAQKVDAIIVQAVDTDAAPKITRLAAAARIPLVCVNLKPSDFDTLPPGVVEAAIKLIRKQPVDEFVNVPFERVTPENKAKYLGKN